MRAQELEQEASLALALQRRADRAYWNDTGISGREADLRAYLERYPDGLFADRAQGALDQIMADNQEQANAAEARAWRDAHNANTVSAYRRYLRNYPKGNFAQDASNRIVSLGVAANGGAA